MRRGLAALSVALVLVGLELSTESLSLTVARMSVGLAALRDGGEFYTSKARFGVGLGLLATGLVVMALLLMSLRVRREVQAVGSACPRCGNRTRRVHRTRAERVLSRFLGEPTSRRKCETCGWVGLSLRG